MALDDQMTKAWREAANDLGIRVNAPFEAKLDDGSVVRFEAQVLDFGSKSGAVVVSGLGTSWEIAKRLGFWVSALEAPYRKYDRQFFIDTLNDWGWFGEKQSSPSWYSGRPWTDSIVVAVDGTAASGKGTLARRLAKHLGFAHLDSGSLYRLTALNVIKAGKNPEKPADAVMAAGRIDPQRGDDPAIRTDEVGKAASIVAAIPAVRAALLEFQRHFASSPPNGAPGAVIDGRDIGTVVCPWANAKLFIDAKPETRARRRWLELQAAGVAKDEAAVLADILSRDKRDRERPVAPLRPADDAVLLDTTLLDIDAAFAAALALVKPRVEEALKARHRG
jgi:cytidylate kinase